MGYGLLFGLILGALALTLADAKSGEADVFPGPVRATVLEILDGDTFLADALVWPGHSVRINIRIRGIDAPEMRSRCEAERAAAVEARQALADLIGTGSVSISNIAGAKYYGRVLADVATDGGEGLAPALIERALVRRYDGGKREGWCR
jgi:micrococcal nuclease